MKFIKAVQHLANVGSAPGSSPTGGALLYAENGVVKVRQPNGIIVPVTPGNGDRATFRPLTAAIARKSVDIVVMGDSISEGAYVSAKAKRYADQLATTLGNKLGVSGRSGYLPSQYGFSTTWTTNPVYSNPSGYVAGVGFGLGMRDSWLTSTGKTVTYTFTGTGADIFFAQGTGLGTFSWAIDGGSATVVDSANATSIGGRKVQIRNLTAGSHTLTIINTGASTTSIIEGVYVYNGDESTGVRVWDASHAGYKASDFVAAGTNTWDASIAAVAPDAVILNLGTNDIAQSRTPAQLQADLATIIDRINTACSAKLPAFFLCIPSMFNGANAGTWQTARTAIQAAAATRAVILIDMGIALGDYFGLTGTDPYGIGYGDGVHFNDLGNRMMAEFIMSTIAPVDGWTQPSAPVTLTDAATITTNATQGSNFRVTLGGNRTLANPVGAVDGQKLLWKIKQDATGSRTLALGNKFRFGTDIANATLSSTAGAVDFMTATYDSADDLFYVIGFVRGY